jgi:hypothetical protein
MPMVQTSNFKEADSMFLAISGLDLKRFPGDVLLGKGWTG